MAQTRSFANKKPSPWNTYPPSPSATILSGSLPTSFVPLKPYSKLGILALVTILNGHCCEQRNTNLKMQYNNKV